MPLNLHLKLPSFPWISRAPGTPSGSTPAQPQGGTALAGHPAAATALRMGAAGQMGSIRPEPSGPLASARSLSARAPRQGSVGQKKFITPLQRRQADAALNALRSQNSDLSRVNIRLHNTRVLAAAIGGAGATSGHVRWTLSQLTKPVPASSELGESGFDLPANPTIAVDFVTTLAQAKGGKDMSESTRMDLIWAIRGGVPSPQLAERCIRALDNEIGRVHAPRNEPAPVESAPVSTPSSEEQIRGRLTSLSDQLMHVQELQERGLRTRTEVEKARSDIREAVRELARGWAAVSAEDARRIPDFDEIIKDTVEVGSVGKECRQIANEVLGRTVLPGGASSG